MHSLSLSPALLCLLYAAQFLAYRKELADAPRRDTPFSAAIFLEQPPLKAFEMLPPLTECIGDREEADRLRDERTANRPRRLTQRRSIIHDDDEEVKESPVDAGAAPPTGKEEAMGPAGGEEDDQVSATDGTGQ
jgi:hypothetical protein